MSDTNVATYLNDHLGGSVVALELLGQLQKAHAGSSLGQFASELAFEITKDRNELEALMARLGVTASLPRQAAAWLGEKAAELKLKLDDPAGPLHLLETVEAVSLGIEGKRSLWRALAKASSGNPGLVGPDYVRLEARAQEQRDQTEKVRLEAAMDALRR